MPDTPARSGPRSGHRWPLGYRETLKRVKAAEVRRFRRRHPSICCMSHSCTLRLRAYAMPSWSTLLTSILHATFLTCQNLPRPSTDVNGLWSIETSLVCLDQVVGVVYAAPATVTQQLSRRQGTPRFFANSLQTSQVDPTLCAL